MGFPVYDYRTDIRNVLVTPQIRSRFLRREPGRGRGAGHSHDLGHEVFVVIQGRAAFEIDGETEELGPGQMCIALAGQRHAVWAVGTEPAIMYLSVTPHIQPTHTGWDDQGNRLPLHFMPSSAYHETDTTSPVEVLIDRYVDAANAVAEAAQANAKMQRELAATLKKALAGQDDDAAIRARNVMWEALFPVYKLAYDLASEWNGLVPRAGRTQ